MRGAVPPLPQYGFMVWCLVKHRDDFASFLYLTRVVAVVEQRDISATGDGPRSMQLLITASNHASCTAVRPPLAVVCTEFTLFP
jgi:hypothetical protein